MSTFWDTLVIVLPPWLALVAVVMPLAWAYVEWGDKFRLWPRRDGRSKS